MNPTKLLAGSLALTLGAAGAVLGLSVGAAEAASGNYTLYNGVKPSVSVTTNPEGSKNLEMTVTPAAPAGGDDITVVVKSTNLSFNNGPIAAAAANGNELDAVISLDGVDYTLRGSQNTVPIAPNDGSSGPDFVIFNGGWTVSSAPGASSATSTTANTAGTTGIGATVRGAEATPVTLKAPTAGGTYPIGLKSVVLNTITGSSTIAVPGPTNDLTTCNATNSANTFPAGKCNEQFDSTVNVASANATGVADQTNGPWNGLKFNVAASYINTAFVSFDIAGPPAPPAAPTNVQGIPGDTKVSVTWTAASSGSPVLSSLVTSTPGDKTCTVTGAATTCDVEGLTNGTAYTFKVTSTNVTGTSPESAASPSVTPFEPTAPSAPTDVVATAGNALADVEWKPPTSNGGASVTGYTVTSTPGSKTCVTTTALTCTVEGLTNGTAYTFAVTATNSAGTSPAGTSNSVTPTAGSTPTTPPAADTAPRTATATVKAYCDVKNAGLGALAQLNLPVTLTVSPGAAAPGSTVSVSVAVNGSPVNSGPTTLAVGAYRMESTIGFNGKSVQLIGPKSTKEAAPEGGLIFAKSQWPTVAKGSIKLPTTTGNLPIVVKDIWYNNIPVDASETDRSTGLTDLFDQRCNASATPQANPKAFTAPTVSVSSDANAPANDTGEDPADDGTGSGSGGSDSGGVLANTGAGQLIAIGLLALAALQVGAIVAVRAQRSTPRPAAHRARH